MTPAFYALLFIVGLFMAGGGVLLMLTSALVPGLFAFVTGWGLIEWSWGKP